MYQDQAAVCGESSYSHLAAQELRSLLECAGLTQAAAARLLDAPERTFRSYCTGTEHVPAAVLYAMRWIAERRPNEERWLQIHWRKTEFSVTRDMNFEISRAGDRITVCVRGGERLLDDEIQNLLRRGVVSIHTSYSSDRLRLPDENPPLGLTARDEGDLPAGSIYLLVPSGRPISEYSLAVSSTAIARNFLRKREAEDQRHEVWLANHTIL